ncbi:MAG: aminotransferase class IV [Candidatus Glassbacteria bacterium]
MLFYVNDRLVPQEEAVISATDRGFIYGDGIFETLLLRGGKVFRMMDHLRRLGESASIIRLKLPWSQEQLAEKIRLTVGENRASEGIIRVNVSRGVGSWRLTTKGADEPTLIISLYPPPDYPPETYTKGWPVIVAKGAMAMDPVIPGRAKTTNRLNLILAKREAEDVGAMEALLLGRSGHLTEGTSTNLFFYSGGKLFTPSQETGILRGVTREIVIDIARRLDIDVTEGFFKPSELHSSNEAFLTFTTAGVVPINSVDGIVIGDGGVGPVTRKIMKAYGEVVERETREVADGVKE